MQRGIQHSRNEGIMIIPIVILLLLEATNLPDQTYHKEKGLAPLLPPPTRPSFIHTGCEAVDTSSCIT